MLTHMSSTVTVIHRNPQTLMKNRLKSAVKGHSLLKKKADALQLRFRKILKEIVEVSHGTAKHMLSVSLPPLALSMHCSVCVCDTTCS